MAPTVKGLRMGRSVLRPVKTPLRVAPLPKAHRIKDVAGKLQERKADLKLTQGQSEEVVQDLLDIVQDILLSGDDVLFQGESPRCLLPYSESVWRSGFGKFSCKETGKREYRNPQTGEKIVRDKSLRVSFQPSTVLKKTLKAHAEALKKERGDGEA